MKFMALDSIAKKRAEANLHSRVPFDTRRRVVSQVSDRLVRRIWYEVGLIVRKRFELEMAGLK